MDLKINWKETQNYNKVKFQNLIKWIRHNGGYIQNIICPVVFKSGEIGIATSQKIQSNTAIAAIPHKLIISVKKALNSQLKCIFDKNPQIFDTKNIQDAEFNVLACYLFYQLLKQQKSFYYPYFQCLPTGNFTMLDWTQEETKLTNSEYLIEQRKYIILQMNSIIQEIYNTIINKQPIFKQFNLTQNKLKQIFYRAYSIVMTRCYGWSLPSTCLIPFADMCNHSDRQNSTHYIIHRLYENNPQLINNQYVIKKNNLNLSLLGIKQSKSKEYKSKKIEFIKRFIKEKQYEEDKIEQYIQKINKERLQNQQTLLQNLQFFTTSNTEDNDTEQDEKNKKQEIKKQLIQKQINLISKKKKQQQKKFKQQEYLQQSQKVQKQNNQQNQNEQIDQQQNWDWLDQYDPQAFFVVTSQKYLNKYQQIYNSYGKRTNRFLLMWYGFCLQTNKYDSYCFRMRLYHKDIYPLHKLAEKSIFVGWIDAQVKQKELLKNQIILKNLSKEFRIKQNQICIDFLSFLRVKLFKYYQKFQEIKCFQIPTSIQYQIFIFEFYLLLLIHILEAYFKNIHDVNYVKSPNACFIKNFRLSQHRIVHSQRNIVRQCLNILVNMKKGSKVEDFNKVITIETLKKIRKYLFQLKSYI